MAWLFDGTTSDLKCAADPVNGYTMGPITSAVLVRQNAVGAQRWFVTATKDGGLNYGGLAGGGTNRPLLYVVNNVNPSSALQVASTVLWYLIVATWPGDAGTLARFHVFNGTSWTHAPATVALPGNATVDAAYIRLAGSGGATPADRLNGPIVCAGMRKADTSDAGVEALTMTTYQSWLDFGFNWLIGLRDLATIANEGSDAGGDEISRAGITLAADPPGWTWPTAPTAARARAQAVLL